MTALVLASRSPRRKELLGLLDLPFEIVVPDTIESSLRGAEAATQASTLAEEKAVSVAEQRPGRIVVAADTLVVLEEQVMGKPPDAESAREMLEALQGRQHRVLSGLAVIDPSDTRPALQLVETRVWMREYGPHEVNRYISRGEPFDKAGAYAIQDRDFHPVERFEGCYANVMGLPLCHLFTALKRLDLPLPPTPVPACEARTGRRCRVAHQILASESD